VTPKVMRPPSASASRQIVPSRLLSVFDVAEALAVKAPKVRMLAARGTIAYYRIGRSLRFKPADVEAFLARVRRPAKAERGL
jgi:excisionase family DNA binding protein